MAMYMPPKGGDFTPPPEGTHPARCYRVIDLGTQQTEFKGTPKRQHKLLLSWELPTERMDDGRPFTIHQRYTFSSSEKSHFRNHLESWRGKKFEESDFGPGGFDVSKLVGVPCLVTVVHDKNGDSTYANVKGIVRLPKGLEVPPPENETVLLILDKDEFQQSVFDKLPDSLKETIRKSPEYHDMFNDAPTPDESSYGALAPDFDDEIPF